MVLSQNRWIWAAVVVEVSPSLPMEVVVVVRFV